MRHADNDNGQTGINIPSSAYEVKAIFDDVPGDDIAAEILAHVERTGEPHTWRGHTHTRPMDGSPVYYVEEFSLPVTHAAQSKWAPCPICSPAAPKYRDKGKIAWFPDEKVIRLIGPECFESISGEAHIGAMKEFKARKTDKDNISYLREVFRTLDDHCNRCEECIGLSYEIDDFYSTLRRKIEGDLGIRLWAELADGTARLETKTKEIDIYGAEREVVARTDFVNIDRPEVLGFRRQALTGNARKARGDFTMLRRLGFDALIEMDQKTRMQKVRYIKKMVGALEVSERAAESDLLFLSSDNLKRLERWLAHEKCPVRMTWRRNGASILIGAPSQTEHTIKMGPRMINAIDWNRNSLAEAA